MNAYTISKLAEDPGISMHMIRNYEQRGLVKPCHCMPSGYRIYNDEALKCLRFGLAGKAAGSHSIPSPIGFTQWRPATSNHSRITAG